MKFDIQKKTCQIKIATATLFLGEWPQTKGNEAIEMIIDFCTDEEYEEQESEAQSFRRAKARAGRVVWGALLGGAPPLSSF